MNNYRYGTIKHYYPEPQHGFIAPDIKGEIVYFELRNLRNQDQAPFVGARVMFQQRAGRSYAEAYDVSMVARTNPDELPEVAKGEIISVNVTWQLGWIQASERVRIGFRFSDLADQSLIPKVGDSVSFRHEVFYDGRVVARQIVLENLAPTPPSVDESLGEDSHPSGNRIAYEPRHRNVVQTLPSTTRPDRNTSGQSKSRLTRAKNAVRIGDAAEAERQYELGMAEKSHHNLALSYAAWLKERGHPDRALHVFERAIKTMSAHPKLFTDAGELASSLGNYDRAIGYFNEALKLRGNHRQPLLGLGRANFLKNTPTSMAESKRWYERVFGELGGIEAVKERAKIRRDAELQVSLERYELTCKAIESRTRAADRGADLLAQALQAVEQGNEGRAEELYESALAKSRNIQPALSYAAWNKKRNRLEMAMTVFERTIQRFPTSAKLHHDAALLAIDLGQVDQSIHLLRRAIELSKSVAEKRLLRLHLARVHVKIGTKEACLEALRIFEVAIKDFGGYETFLVEAGYGTPLAIFLRLHVLARMQVTDFGRGVMRTIESNGLRLIHAEFLPSGSARLLFEIIEGLRELYGVGSRLLALLTFEREVSEAEIGEFDSEFLPSAEHWRADPNVALLLTDRISEETEALLRRRTGVDRNANDRRPIIVPFTFARREAWRQNDTGAVARQFGTWLFQRDLFLRTTPVAGSLFFGRDESLQEIRRSIEERHPLGVFGLRRTGKTSLLREAQRRFLNQRDLIVLVELQNHAVAAGTGPIYRQILGELQSQAERSFDQSFTWSHRREDYQPVKDADTYIVEIFNRDVELILASAFRRSPPPKLVVFIDEIEKLLPTSAGGHGMPGGVDFLGHMRGVSQKHELFAFVLAGANATVSEAPRLERKDNPLFRYLRPHYLPMFPPSLTGRMLSELGRGMGVRFDDQALDRIHTLTGGHPYIARDYCSFLSRRHPERPLHITEKIVDDAIEEYVVKEAPETFSEMYGRVEEDYGEFGRAEAALLLACARSEKPLTLADAVAVQGRVSPALAHLEGYQLVRVHDGLVHFRIELLRQYLLRTHGTT
jgi:tetratricopeptide (TPR) repeat protein/cold shock CspA family protein